MSLLLKWTPGVFTGALLCLLLISPVMATAQGEGAGFDKQVPLAEWASLVKKVTSFRYTEVSEHSEIQRGKAAEKTARYVQNLTWCPSGFADEFFATSYDDNGKEKPEPLRFRITNQQYFANIEAADERRDWRLAGLKLGKGLDAEIQERAIWALPWLICARSSLSLWLADDSFVVVRSEVLQGVNGKPIRVHFIYDRSKRKSKYTPGTIGIPDNVEGGFLELDSANSYRLTRYEFRIKTAKMAYTLRGTLEYEIVAGFPVATKRIDETIGVPHPATGPYDAVGVYQCKMEFNCIVSEEEFRLSHYGLPEPVGVSWPSPTRWYLWFIAGGFVCVGAGIFLWRRTQLRAVREAKSPK